MLSSPEILREGKALTCRREILLEVLDLFDFFLLHTYIIIILFISNTFCILTWRFYCFVCFLISKFILAILTFTCFSSLLIGFVNWSFISWSCFFLSSHFSFLARSLASEVLVVIVFGVMIYGVSVLIAVW